MAERLGVVLTLLVLSMLDSRAAEAKLNAPNSRAKPVNQLVISGNACGPAALLTSFRLASPAWQDIESALPGSNDRSRLSYLIKHYGMRPSKHLGRTRWDARAGVNLLDLTDIGNELRGTRSLPTLDSQILLRKDRESGAKLLKRCHRQLSRSLHRGLPPVVGLQRLTARRIAGTPSWVTVHGHFVVITGMPRTLKRGATWMPFQYADPWGGKKRMGIVKFDQSKGFPALVVEMPYSNFGRNKLKKGEPSIVILSSCIGAF
jgi:hypothetical protein